MKKFLPFTIWYLLSRSAACTDFPLPTGPNKIIRGVWGALERCFVDMYVKPKGRLILKNFFSRESWRQKLIKWDLNVFYSAIARANERKIDKKGMPPGRHSLLLTRIVQCCCEELKYFLGSYVKVRKYQSSKGFSSVTNDPSDDWRKKLLESKLITMYLLQISSEIENWMTHQVNVETNSKLCFYICDLLCV